MSSSVVNLTVEDELAIVTINNPPVNASSHAVRAGIASALSETNENQTLKAVLLRCTGSTFVAGADISEFGKPPQAPTLPSVINDIEHARIPWLAVVHGTALGGGLELTLACRFRIADEKSSFGLPEVNLGLIPGAGGTARLPRLIDMNEALKLITTGKPIKADQAKTLGLVDETVSGDLLEAARSFAHNHVIGSDRPAVYKQPVINPLSDKETEIAAEAALSRRQFAKAAAIETVANGAKLPFDESLRLAQDTFQRLRESDQSKALRHLFFAERSVSKIPSLKGVKASSINEVGIVGGGTMGVGIASSALLSKLKVTLIERDEASASNAQDKVEKILASSVARGIINEEKSKSFLSNFSTSTDYGSLSNADIVIEAVFEDITVKKNVFEKLDEHTKSTAILASNTSYLDIASIANATKNPSRVVGLHYFSPAHIMKLVEVIRTDVVAPEVLATTLKFAKNTGKIAVPTGNCRGFIGNRIMSAYRKTSECLIEDGALPYQVDTAMKNYGYPMGIFEMQDLAGLDIGWAMRKTLSISEKAESRYVDIADKLCEDNRFGRKTGSGYYLYEDGKTPVRDDWVEQLIESESARKGITRRSFTEAEIMSAILEQIHTEASAILKEGIADSPEAIDVVMVNGYGFPRWRGGPMFASREQTSSISP